MTRDIQPAQAPSPATPATGQAEHAEHGGSRLGPFLCWAVVFADIGTSVYYTPGILFGQVNKLAGLFVTMTLVVFLLLTLKYAEVSVRFPEGGGVVTVAARGLNPWAGAVGGMFILVDYFLTSSISSLSGIQYFGTVIPALQDHFIQLIVTIVVVALLGLLNWYGVKESATVSLIFALGALLTDLAILVALVFTVPLHTLVSEFAKMFNGEHLTVPIVLTGYAGAFLAFSGLESISQLSPVMRVPRSKTVTRALALVVITVGITSPLLTIYSTTLLNAAHTDPNVFISKLAGFAAGPVLEILTAVTASALLVFASNTAIIGAYHVFLALSRMQFFPKIVEKTNRLRGTPHVAIILATGIPIAVLIGVNGRIDFLGDMYAFGLLGAFSLTCIALDVIRWRERHGGAHIGETAEHEEREAAARRRLPELAALQTLQERIGPAGVERMWHLRRQMAQRRAAMARGMAPAASALKRAWPDLRYYLGFLTTLLVVLAWVINLRAKPLATYFGGGLTILGVGISVIHYRYQQSKGTAPVFPMAGLRRIPNSILVLLGPHVANNLAVARAAIESADGRTLVFLYLGEPIVREVRALAFNDPYLFDEQAQATFVEVANLCRHEHVPAQFIYRVRGPRTVLDVWRIIRPAEIMADAEASKPISKQVAPEYVRFQHVDGTRVAHYMKHAASEADATARAARAGAAQTAPPAPTRGAGPSRAATEPAEYRAAPRPAPEQGPPARRERGEAAQPPNGVARPAPAPGSAPAEQPAGTLDLGDYVWTGTELVRRSELPPAAEESEGSAGEEEQQEGGGEASRH